MKATLSTGPNIVQKETEIGLSKSCKVTGLNGHRHCQWCWNEFTRPVMLTCLMITISSVQSLSRVRLFATPWIAACQAFLSITNSWSSLKLMSIKSVMPSNHLILCRPLLLLSQSLPASGFFPMSQHFAWGGQSIGVSASASVLPMNHRHTQMLFHDSSLLYLELVSNHMVLLFLFFYSPMLLLSCFSHVQLCVTP